MKASLNWLIAVSMLTSVCTGAHAAPPRVTHERYKLELVAEEPDIVTPVGMAFDASGRLLVIESHTHQNPENYSGPRHDRIRMLADSNGDGRPDRWTTFAEGFRHAMNLHARADGAVYVVTRGSVVLLQDTDGDGAADKQQVLVRLETTDDYPHNALGGIDQEADGSLILGLGENHGDPFRLIGSDGRVIEATGGLDGFFRCSPDGANLQHIARGVWNPFGLCVVPDGRIFAVDNDPDASPPCRLLHVVPGGDYGYLYQYGRAGTHPLQCWNGELPGTLPMVCGTGEAPTAVVAHAGSLWVTSWGDHRIERYRLVPRGASYSATLEVVVQGDADFRPAGMAVAPDGSLYFGDWVLRNYPVHGRGRIWRLALPADEIATPFPPRSQDELNGTTLADTNAEVAAVSDDPYVRAAGVWRLAEREDVLAKVAASPGVQASPQLRLSLLAAQWLRGIEQPEPLLRAALADESPDVRLYAVRWIADDRLTVLRDEVARLLAAPQPSQPYYLAVLAAIDWLDHDPEMRARDFADELLARELSRDDRPPEARTLALSLLLPDHDFLAIERLRGYLQSDHPPLRLEAVRSLALQSGNDRFELLAEVAREAVQPEDVRLEAVMGLAAAAEPHQELLQSLASSDNAALRREAVRVLRLAGLRPTTPAELKPAADDLSAWQALLAEGGDAAAGRRLFFSSVGGRCAACHQHGGRGIRIGPALTHVGRNTSRERIITSILAPNQEVAPQYQAWVLVTSDGKTHSGLRLAEGGDDGKELYLDATGTRFELASGAIESRGASAVSIMPSGLEGTLSIDDLRDLVAFLVSPP